MKPRATDKPVFYLLAGTIPAKAEFVNADLYEAAQLQHIADPIARSEQARLWADARRAKLLMAGQSFVSETVFSHASKLTLIADAQAQGFFVMLLVAALDHPTQLLERVTRRVSEGGHTVPAQRILERYPRTLANLTQAVRIADAAVLYDSTDSAAGTQKTVALCKGAWTQELVAPLPAWAKQVLGLDPGA